SGSLVLLEDADGRRFARIENLATDRGPDVYVYLSTNTVDGPEEAFDDDYVDLGALQGNLGNQNYEIPAGTDLSRYRSVVIWCDRFDSAFGAAPLG
ncbi:MAG: DM13 domain-containing protein, partial [Ilumatobacteraceae bacterium]